MTGIIVVTHDGLGEALRRQAETIVGHPLELTTIPISPGTDPDVALDEVRAAISAGADADGALVLTDLPGATPHNLAVRAAATQGAPVISGLNLPMLLKVVNHAARPPGELAGLARRGGIQGVTEE
ncbi:MAG: PTS sugar transporter subunit IIA [Wenzhouxiangella sp.]